MNTTLPGVPIILRTVLCPVARAAGEIPTARAAVRVRWVEFAHAIWERYAGRAWPWLPQSLVFRQDRPPVAAHLHQHSHTHAAPRLSLTVLTWPALSSGSSSSVPPLPMTQVRVAQETHVHRTFIHTARSSAPEQLASRLIAQGKRSETETIVAPIRTGASKLSETDDSAIAQASLPMAQPVPRIVRHGPPAEPGYAAATRPTASAHAESREQPETASSGPHLAATSIDLKRLTEQVIQAIDQRIVAQRERLGRI